MKAARPLWQIVSRQATHDQKTQTLYYRDAKLRNRRRAGAVAALFLLSRSHGETAHRLPAFRLPWRQDLRLGVATPYFWAVAPNADLTFPPRLDHQAGACWPKLNGATGWPAASTTSGYGIYQLEPVEASRCTVRWRGAARTKGDFRINDDLDLGLGRHAVSDATSSMTMTSTTAALSPTTLHVTGLAERNYATAQALHYQTPLQTEDQDALPAVLPYVNTSYIFDQPVLGGELGFDFSAYSLTPRRRRLRLRPRHRADPGGRRSQLAASDISGMGQVVTPFARMRSDIYMTENVPGAASPDRIDRLICCRRPASTCAGPSSPIRAWPRACDAGGPDHRRLRRARRCADRQ